MRTINFRLFLYVFIFLLPVSSGNIQIDIGKPYSNGKILMTENNIHDSIIFSDEIKIVFEHFLFNSGISTGGTDYYCFSFKMDGKQNWGIRYDERNIFARSFWTGVDDPRLKWVSTSYDTIWGSLFYYPDSLSPVDSMELAFTPPSYIGKFIMNRLNYTGGHAWSIYTKAIIYAQIINNRKIAFQCNNFIFSGTPPNEEFISFDLNWASDSLGNGIFSLPTAIKNNKNESKLFNNNVKNTKNALIWCYDIRGRKLIQKNELTMKNNINMSTGLNILIIKTGQKEKCIKFIKLK